MDKISVNLLPTEIKNAGKDTERKSLILKIGVSSLVFMVILSAASLLMALTQNVRLNEAKKKTEAARSQVEGLKDHESLVVVLKSRLNIINNLSSLPSPPGDAYILITSLLPQNIKLLDFNIEKSNKVLLGGETTDLQSLETFFNSITDPKINLGKIKSVKVESLTKTNNQRFRFDLGIVISPITATKI